MNQDECLRRLIGDFATYACWVDSDNARAAEAIEDIRKLATNGSYEDIAGKLQRRDEAYRRRASAQKLLDDVTGQLAKYGVDTGRLPRMHPPLHLSEDDVAHGKGRG